MPPNSKIDQNQHNPHREVGVVDLAVLDKFQLERLLAWSAEFKVKFRSSKELVLLTEVFVCWFWVGLASAASQSVYVFLASLDTSLLYTSFCLISKYFYILIASTSFETQSFSGI